MAALLSDRSVAQIAEEDHDFLSAPLRRVVLAFEAPEPDAPAEPPDPPVASVPPVLPEEPTPARGPVGFASVCQGPQPWELRFVPEIAPEPELVKLYTLARTHGTGLGSALLEAAVGEHEAVYLWIMSGNERAERFYRRHGFHEIAPRFAAGGPWAGQQTHRMRRDRAKPGRPVPGQGSAAASA